MNNVVTTLVPLFLIGSFSFLQVHVTRTTIKPQMGLKFGWIRLRTVELTALECLEKNIDLYWEKRCGHSSAFILRRSFCIVVDNKDNDKSLDEFEFRPDPIAH